MQHLSGDHFYIFQSRWWQLNSILCNLHSTTLIWDPAYDPFELEAILIQAAKFESSSKYLLFTHGDYDHIAGGVNFEDYQLVGSTAFRDKSDKEQVIQQINNLDHEFYVERKKPVTFPVLDIPIVPANPTILKLGNLEVIFFRAAGHTPDGLFTLVPELGLWVAGDYLSDIEFPFVEDELKDYLATLETARRLLDDYAIKVMVPGHGNPAYSKDEILKRIDHSERYVNSLTQDTTPDWRTTWGSSPFHHFLDKMHLKNIAHVRSATL